jgi:uncharacterized protein (TIGR02302 family)
MLWRRHRRLAAAALSSLGNRWPASTVARRDAFALRAVVILCLVIAAAGAAGDAGPRLKRALLPQIGGGTGPLALKLWITPPAYTNRSPIFVEIPPPRTGAPPPRTLDVPQGSKALVVVTGAGSGTALALKTRGRTDVRRLRELGEGGAESSRLETVLAPADRIEVRRNSTVIAAWPVNWIADKPPRVTLRDDPRDSSGGKLRIDYMADDDYGIAKMTLRVARAGDVPAETDDALALDLPPPPAQRLHAPGSALVDLAGNPWAGLPVTLQLTVVDQAGQSATSGTVNAVLPERTFTHPVAQEIARRRKELMADAAKAAGPALDAFARILEHPERFNGDPVVTLALSSALYRLMYQEPSDAMTSMPALLWHAAVRVEDGDKGAAEARLAAAEQELQNALERGANGAEIDRLVNQLQQALAEYMRAIAERMGDKTMELGGLDASGEIVSPDDISQMMEQMRELSRMGARDAAQQMLSRIQNMLQSLRNAGAGEGENPDMRAAEEMMRDLGDLTDAQSQLLDESFAHVRDHALHTDRPQASGAAAAQRQEKLRQRLADLARRFNEMTGKSQDDLGAAEKSMREAENLLKADAWQPGAQAEGAALARLQSGMREGAQQMLQALAEKGVTGFVQMPRGSAFGGYGRRGGPDQGDQVKVPDRPDADGMAKRARAIMEELRRRASDRERPASEQDYLRRLMKQF